MRLRNIPGAKAAITGSSYVVQNPEEWKGKWKQCFTKEQPLHIEVGMGKGRFLMDMASLHPEINYPVFLRLLPFFLSSAVHEAEHCHTSQHLHN